MDGVGGVPGAAIRVLGRKAAGLCIATGGFRPNGSGAISVFRGTLAGQFTVAYGSTGLYTVTMTPTGFKFPTGRFPIIVPTGYMVDVSNTNRFQVCNKAGWVNATRSFILAAWQDTAAFAIPSDAQNWVDFAMLMETK